MANRTASSASAHDAAVRAAGEIYRDHGKTVWINPDGEKNKSWCDYYIDVIAVDSPSSNEAWVVEIETGDSVSNAEADGQWKEYDSVYTVRWYLAVPRASEQKARNLVNTERLQHCSIVTWEKGTDGRHTFWGLPGLD